MRYYAYLYLISGAALALVVLRIAHGQYANIGLIVLYAAVPNVLTGLLAVLIYRHRREGLRTDALLLVTCYLIGIGAGAYFYYT